MKYEALCEDCHSFYDYIRSVAERANVPPCPHCGGKGHKFIGTPPVGCVAGKFEPFVSQLDGSLIRNNRELQEHNKRNNVCLLGEGYSNEDILAGKIGQQAPTMPDKKEIAKDILESIRKCEAGYKPKIEEEGAEL